MARKTQKTPQSRARSQHDGTISPALVRKIADRVYARLLLELRLDRERARPASRWKGGRP